MINNQKDRTRYPENAPDKNDPTSNKETVKQNVGISDQENELADKEELGGTNKSLLGARAEKYIKAGGDIEDLPDEDDIKEAEEINKTRNAPVVDDDDGEYSDEVIGDENDKVPK